MEYILSPQANMRFIFQETDFHLHFRICSSNHEARFQQNVKKNQILHAPNLNKGKLHSNQVQLTNRAREIDIIFI